MSTRGGWVAVGPDPRGGRVYQDTRGHWHAWRRGRGEIGAYASEARAALALSRAPSAKRPKCPTGEHDGELTLDLTGDDELTPGKARLVGDVDNHFVVDSGGRTIDAVSRTSGGRYVAWARTEKLGEHATPVLAEAEVRLAHARAQAGR